MCRWGAAVCRSEGILVLQRGVGGGGDWLSISGLGGEWIEGLDSLLSVEYSDGMLFQTVSSDHRQD